MNNTHHRYFIRMSYVGTQFNGWQIQDGSPSIQAETERALRILLKEDSLRVTGAGRTDTGVHAKTFYAHFDSYTLPEEMDILHLIYKCNRILPRSIAIHDIFPVHGKAHARFHAIKRTYQYYISTIKDPFVQDRAWIYERELNMQKMQEAANMLMHHDDFSSFAKSNSQVKTHICNVSQAEWSYEQHLIRFEISADRFLRNMVRAITGTLVDVGIEKISPGDFAAIIESGDRSKAGYSAPACGLYLTDIQYPEGILQGEAPLSRQGGSS